MVPIADPHTLAHLFVIRRSRSARLELEPVEHYRLEGIRWRLAKLIPFVLAPTYADLWRAKDRETRGIMFDAIFLSGDYHYGAASREIRQILARWLHARLMVRGDHTAQPKPAQAGELM